MDEKVTNLAEKITNALEKHKMKKDIATLQSEVNKLKEKNRQKSPVENQMEKEKKWLYEG